MSIRPADPRTSSTFSRAAAHVSGGTGVALGSGVGAGVATASCFCSTGGGSWRQLASASVSVPAKHTASGSWQTGRASLFTWEVITEEGARYRPGVLAFLFYCSVTVARCPLAMRPFVLQCALSRYPSGTYA